MNENLFPIDADSDAILNLQEKIEVLKGKIEEVEIKLFPFEQSLRNAIADLLIEERELTILYKEQKKAKKEKRLAQKRKGKNYKEPIGIVPVSKKEVAEKTNQKEKKRLYKEAMLYVHPDKFSMQENEQQKALETTTKLIEIYQNGSFEELEAFHAHIFGGNTTMNFSKDISLVKKTTSNATYLKKEIERLEKQLTDLLYSYTYKVLTTYKNPLSFVDELKAYYDDRIFKLRKRTRTKK
ncbi:hypothetical protein [Tenacibaculum sp. L6]|uniref:hypothetical protein n=1 Tax=Tenacibaculum sp. L6 TaxID=2992764 RepID=UPI00237A5D68|nr:hypothetical protein [Tenacibaculum sp. L6]MDE0536237.1 hypothetical protein [Tenacibaculum sp. L6]